VVGPLSPARRPQFSARQTRNDRDITADRTCSLRPKYLALTHHTPTADPLHNIRPRGLFFPANHCSSPLQQTSGPPAREFDFHTLSEPETLALEIICSWRNIFFLSAIHYTRAFFQFWAIVTISGGRMAKTREMIREREKKGKWQSTNTKN
jgi:hypothetical protein